MSDDAVREGHISFEQAEGMAGRPGKAPWGGPRTGEVLIYFGAIALAVATLVWTFDLAFGGGMLALFLGSIDNIPAGLLSLAGAAILLFLGTRFADHEAGAISRAGGFTLLAGFGLASVASGLLLFDLDLGDATPLVTLIPVALVAVYVYRVKPSVPTHLALFSTAVQALGALLVLVQVSEGTNVQSMVAATILGGVPDVAEEPWIALLAMTALGLAWIWLGATGRVRTRNVAFFLGASYAWFQGINLFATADGWIVLSLAIAGAFAFGATQFGSSVLGGFATVATIALILQIVSVVTDEPTVTTFIVAYGVPGLLALAGAWMLTRTPAPAATAMPEATGS